MRQIIIIFLIFFSFIGCCQADHYHAMLKELRVINSNYQDKYNENPLIKKVMDKTMQYRLDPKLGKGEYVSNNEQRGLKDFEDLQTSRDQETIAVYREHQSSEYLHMMIDYNDKRKTLRLRLMDRKISWRQFSDSLEDLIVRNRAKESDYRHKVETNSFTS